ncbi:MAG: glycosyltransferase family 4 protein [Elusimicrobia bacterium]|nr:glycosyltransferase family 4 protein [Elusimicrobiota bacterium]
MKALIVQRYMSYYGGAENVVKELSENLLKMGVENSVIALNNSEETKEIYKNIKLLLPKKPLPNVFRSTDFFSALGIIRELYWLRKLLVKYYKSFDVINIHNFPANWVVFGIDKPIVWMCNEPPDFYSNPKPSLLLKILRYFGILIDKFFVQHYVDIICVADKINAERVEKRYKKTPIIIPYGIDQQSFTAKNEDISSFLKGIGVDSDELVLLQVGVISPQKNQIESIKALQSLMNKGIKAKLVLAGKTDGPYFEFISKYIADHNLSKFIVFTGHVNRETIGKLYKRAQVCLFPVKEQGGWLAPFEALLNKKPVIVSKTMGAAAIINENNFGIVADNFSLAIIEMNENLYKYQQNAEKASEWIRNNLTWDNFAKKFISVFAQAIHAKGEIK